LIHDCFETFFISSEDVRRDVPQILKFSGFNIFSFTLGESIEEDCAIANEVDKNHSVSAGSALAGAGNPLFDESSSKVRIDDSALCSVDGFKQARIRDVLSSGKSGEPLGLENPQDRILCRLYEL